MWCVFIDATTCAFPFTRTVDLSWAFVPPSPALQNDVYYEDDLCVVIYDKYPKAKYHLLLIAKVKRSSAPSWCRTSFTWQLVTLTGYFRVVCYDIKLLVGVVAMQLE